MRRSTWSSFPGLNSDGGTQADGQAHVGRWLGQLATVDGPPDEPPADPESIARAICLRLLTGAARTRADLAEALRRRGVPEEAADAVLNRLCDVGLIDDEAFADAWVTSRQAGRGLARRALAAELRRRGVDDEVAERALAKVSGDDEVSAAQVLVERRLAASRGLPTETRIRRLSSLLARKGYSSDVALRVVRELLDDEARSR